MEIILKDREIKQILEEILLKLLTEKREIFKEILEEIMEDIALTKAIEAGRKNEFVSRESIVGTIEDELKI